MPWYRVQLSTEDMQLGVLGRMVNTYSEMRLRAGGPKNAPMYNRQATDGSVTVYFSPLAAKIAGGYLQDCGAEVCQQPTGVSMLVGDQSDATHI